MKEKIIEILKKYIDEYGQIDASFFDKIASEICQEQEKEIKAIKLVLLNEYTHWLLDHAYVDTDVFEEIPPAIDQFIQQHSK